MSRCHVRAINVSDAGITCVVDPPPTIHTQRTYRVCVCVCVCRCLRSQPLMCLYFENLGYYESCPTVATMLNGRNHVERSQPCRKVTTMSTGHNQIDRSQPCRMVATMANGRYYSPHVRSYTLYISSKLNHCGLLE